MDKKFQILFESCFTKISKNLSKSTYNWDNYKSVFTTLKKNICVKHCDDINNIVTSYELFIIYYIFYTNYLKYVNHEDIGVDEMFEIYNEIKYDENLIKNISRNYDTIMINILDTLNPFLIEKGKKDGLKNISSFLTNIRRLNNIYSMDTKNENKKLLSIILYRYSLSNSLKYDTFNKFYVNTVNIEDLNKNMNFDTFVKSIPDNKFIMNLNIECEIKNNLKIKIELLIEFIVKKMGVKIFITKKDDIIIIENENGKIMLKHGNKYKMDLFKQCTKNLNMSFETPEWLKKSNNLINIEYADKIIKNLSIVMQFTHIFTIGLKLLNTTPKNVQELLYPIDYTNYYYDTFTNFLFFIKDFINGIDLSYNRFYIDLLKYYYIYAYYDYYFYYDNKLSELLKTCTSHKNEIFKDFCDNLQLLFKLPTNMSSYPPFFKIIDDIDNIIYYTHEIPSYFKLFDFILATKTVFKISSPNIKDIVKHIKLINVKHKNKSSVNNFTIKGISSSFGGADNISKYTENNVLVEYKPLLHNKSAFMEVNIENTENYELKTDKN